MTWMKRNVGSIDRILRIGIGITLLSLVPALDGGLRWLGLVGILPILTAAFSYCPLYPLLKVNTTRA
jgi:hypothetical protein